MKDPNTGSLRFGEEIAQKMNPDPVNETQDTEDKSTNPCSENVTGASAYDIFKAMLCCALKR